MKKTTFLFFLTLFSASSYSQSLEDMFYNLNFEDTAQYIHLRIDPMSNHNNLWQVGSPQKTLFNLANSTPNVIVTDTVNSYPINDTSSFTIVNVTEGGGFIFSHTVVLAGNYSVNSDTLTDFGTIEFSPNNGTTWIDLINDITYSSYIHWEINAPTLTGNSYGWQPFNVNLAELGPIFNIQYGDTVLYRFTFTSDDIETNKDGLMFDDLHFEDWHEGINEIQNDDLISISPNPTSDELRIHKNRESNNQKIEILSYAGQVMYTDFNFIGTSLETKDLANGMYFLKYSTKDNFSIKKFIVQH